MSVFSEWVSAEADRAPTRRFEAAAVRYSDLGISTFREHASEGDVPVSGRFHNSIWNAELRLPQFAGADDAFIWGVQYRRHQVAFFDVGTGSSGEEVGRTVFGAPLEAPFQSLQFLRGLWTWRHQLNSGYSFYLHNRSGFFGEQLRFDGRWIRIGLAGALERQFAPNHSLGGGVLFVIGIGEPQTIPFVRYLWSFPGGRVQVLLPVYARAYWQATERLELGIAVEADGNRYRLEPGGRSSAWLERIYSSYGPSARWQLPAELFLRVDVGLTGYQLLEFNEGAVGRSELDLEASRALLVTLSYEPAY